MTSFSYHETKGGSVAVACQKKLEKPLRPVILGSWSPPVLACVRSWGKRGWPVGLLSVQGTEEGSPSSKYLAAWRPVDPSSLGTAKGFQIISEFLRDFQASGLACINESIALWLHSEMHRQPECPPLWYPDSTRLEKLLDKCLQIEAARLSGLDVLPTVVLDTCGNRIPKLSPIWFPLALRPSRSGCVPFFKVKLVSNQRSLEEFIFSLKSISGPLLGQPFQDLPNLVVHGARSLGGDLLALQGFIVPRKFEGLALSLKKVSIPESLKNGCRAFLNRLNVVGVFHFDFLWDPEKQKAWFLEINNRLGGTTAKVYSLGYDEPLYLLRAFGVEFTSDSHANDVREGTASSRQALLKYLAHTLTRRLTPFDYPQESTARRVGGALWGLIAYHDDVAARDDLEGTINLYWANLWNKLRPRLKGR